MRLRLCLMEDTEQLATSQVCNVDFERAACAALMEPSAIRKALESDFHVILAPNGFAANGPCQNHRPC